MDAAGPARQCGACGVMVFLPWARCPRCDLVLVDLVSGRWDGLEGDAGYWLRVFGLPFWWLRCVFIVIQVVATYLREAARLQRRTPPRPPLSKE